MRSLRVVHVRTEDDISYIFAFFVGQETGSDEESNLAFEFCGAAAEAVEGLLV